MIPFLIIFLFLFEVSAQAGGPLYVTDTGFAAHWESFPITLHPEEGDCNQFSNAEMISRLETQLSLWTSIDNISLSFAVTEGSIEGDVNADNFNDTALLESATLHPIIFDSDGSIIESLYGQSSQYYFLGFAGFTAPSETDGVIESGLALFNCLCIENDTDCPGLIAEEELDATIVHEMGHFIGLDHSAVNEDLVNAPCDTAIAGDCDTVPIMYPTTYDANEVLQLQQDDRLAALALYGEDAWDDGYCLITGRLIDVDGNALRCADVQAQTDDPADTVSFISGYYALASDDNNDGDSTDDGECASNCGDFSLYLDPNKSYTISIKELSGDWVSSSSVGPCKNDQFSGIVDEELSTVSGCTAGESTDLGSIQTASTGGVVAEEETEDSEETGSSADCGSDGDFEDCDELLSCSLNNGAADKNQIDKISWGIYFALILMFRYRRIMATSLKLL